MKVLIVDDSAVMRRILSGILRQECGVKEIVQAADGEEALEVWQKTALDFVLLDWNMPKLNGMSVLKAMRAVDSEIPIIMITTEVEKPRIVEAISNGASNYIIKPFSTKTVVRKIKAVLVKHDKA